MFDHVARPDQATWSNIQRSTDSIITTFRWLHEFPGRTGIRQLRAFTQVWREQFYAREVAGVAAGIAGQDRTSQNGRMGAY